MKKLLVAGIVAAALCSTPALAADLPTKAPVYKAPVAAVAPPMWTGCYVGGNVGYGWGRQDWTFTDGDSGGQPHTNGWMAGGQIGCDYQFANNWVVGVAGMYDWANLKGSVIDPSNKNDNANAKVESLGDVVARLGYTFDRGLLYVDGGVAWVHNNRSFTSQLFGGSVVPGFDDSNRKSGWTLGVGLEYLIAANWSWKIEYNHFDFGSSTAFSPTGEPISTGQRIDTVLVGINYRFGTMGKAPVVAKY